MQSQLSKSIDEEHDQAEIIIGWIQFAFVVALLGIWAIAPKAHNGNMAFEAVPSVLGIYLPLIALRLYWAYRRLLNEAVLYIYCLLDSATVTGLIFLFHIQYDAPATVYLKAPTYLYLLMFVALRVLRHEVKYIITMGALSIISMSALVVYAANSSDVKRTSSFLEFASSNALLIGAEIDKILAIALITAILVVSVYRSQKLMMKNVMDAQARKDLTKFFSPEVAENITSSKDPITPGTGRIRSAAILSMDIRGFTKMSQDMKPSETMRLLSDYQARMVRIILKHGGSIDKFMGDGILAHFGAAKPTSTYAADCMRTIDALSNETHNWNTERIAQGLKPLKFGIASAVGDVMFGAVGDSTRLEYTTIGDAVNLCAKLESHTKEVDALALTTKVSIETAYKQGYLQPARPFVALNESEIQGVDYVVDLIILHVQNEVQHYRQAS